MLGTWPDLAYSIEFMMAIRPYTGGSTGLFNFMKQIPVDSVPYVCYEPKSMNLTAC